MIPGVFVPGPALLFSRPSVRSECRSFYLHPGPRMAASMSPGPGISLLAYLDDIVVWPRQGHAPGADAAGDVLPPGDGLQTESGQVSPVSGHDSRLVGYPMVAQVWSLASTVGGTVTHSSNRPGLAGVSQGHAPPPGADGGSPHVCVPGAQVPPTLCPTFERKHCSGSGDRAGQTRPSPSVHVGLSAVLDVSRSLGTRSL